MEKGEDVLEDRTGVGRRKLFAYQMRFNLKEGLPVLTTKSVHTKSVFHELIWLLSGSTNIKYLVDNGVRIWNEWPYENWLQKNGWSKDFPKYSESWTEKMKEFVELMKTDSAFAKQWGELGPTYAHQWRNFGATLGPDGSYNHDGFDQIANVINLLKTNPASTRIIVTGWHAVEATQVALPPCHTLFQFNTVGKKIITHLYMRSADAFLGVPFNIASYATLANMIAQVTDMEATELVITFNDFHIYLNHFDQVKEQLTREPKALPILKLNPAINNIFDFKFEDLTLENYEPMPAIPAPVAV